MDDYIKRSKAVKAFMNAEEIYDPGWGNKRFSLADAEEILSGVEPADVRPVVLCRDCENAKHWYSDKCLCYLWIETGIDVFNDGFCSYGKRREGGADG